MEKGARVQDRHLITWLIKDSTDWQIKWCIYICNWHQRAAI